MQTVAANLGQLAFDALDAPPVVVGSRNWITPAAEMEEAFFPQPAWMVDAVHERIVPLPGHRVSSNQTLGEFMKRSRAGV
jgi:2-oxoisovalerate dehydrogenase E1 component